MDAWNIRESSFYPEHRSVTKRWVVTIIVAICLHAGALAVSVSLPHLISRKPLLDEVMTVDLVGAVEVPRPETAAPAPAPPAPPVKKIVAEKPPKKPAVTVAPPEPVSKPAPVAKPVSIQPAHKKKKVAPDNSREEELRRQQDLRRQQQLEAIRRQAQQEARQQEQIADEAARQAREALAALLKNSNNVQEQPVGRSTGGRQVTSIVLKQYLVGIDDRLRRFWVLPEMRKWERDLETVVVLTVRRNGSVAAQEIEKSSGDPFYDEFVRKTIQNASPFPAFPALMDQDSIEIGIRFRPGELVM